MSHPHAQVYNCFFGVAVLNKEILQQGVFTRPALQCEARILLIIRDTDISTTRPAR